MKKLVKALSYLIAVSLIVFLLPITTNAVTPTYVYEWVSQSGTISSDGLAHEYTNLVAGQSINLSLQLINRSGVTIRAKHKLGNPIGGKQVPVGSYGIGSQTPYQDGTPSFLNLSSFILNNNRFVYYEGNDVPNNGLITLNWSIRLKNTLPNGIYNLYVRPVSEYLAWTRQSKNGQLLPSNNSDIFWRLVVGEGSSVTGISPGIYFAQSQSGVNNLVDFNNGQSTPFVAGYEIVSQHAYPMFPEYLILQKNNQLYSYNIKHNLLNPVFGNDPLGNLNPQSDELVSVLPSITEKGKFIIVIDKIVETQGMLGYDIISTRSYTLNASINQTIFVSNLMTTSRSSCRRYDSKYTRFFTWPCGEGIGTSIPLEIRDLSGNILNTVVSSGDFAPHGQGGVFYSNGVFFAVTASNISDGTDHKIITIKPEFFNPTKTIYTINPVIRPSSMYSIAISEATNAFVMGGAQSVSLLRYNPNTRGVTDVETIPDAQAYINFPFVYNGKLYYRPLTSNIIRVFDLNTFKLEKSLSASKLGDVTLISVN